MFNRSCRNDCFWSGEFFGELALITSEPRSASVRASTDKSLEVFTLLKHDFNKVGVPHQPCCHISQPLEACMSKDAALIYNRDVQVVDKFPALHELLDAMKEEYRR
eukprot:SAG31_NODE_6921_length_1849_cov_1.912571_1_plen_106_part_00